MSKNCCVNFLLVWQSFSTQENTSHNNSVSAEIKVSMYERRQSRDYKGRLYRTSSPHRISNFTETDAAFAGLPRPRNSAMFIHFTMSLSYVTETAAALRFWPDKILRTFFT